MKEYNENEAKEFFNRAKGLAEFRLRQDEKNAIESRLLEFMNQHPVIKTEVERPGLWESFYSITMAPMKILFSKPAGVVVALLVLTGAGTGFAAQNSLPGDLLYPIKVNINEPLRASLSFSDESRAKFAIEQTQTRLEEAEKLSLDGRLNADLSAKINEKIDEHLNVAGKNMSTLGQRDGESGAKADLEDELSTALTVHAEIISKISTTNNNPVAIEALGKISEKVESAIRANAQSTTPTTQTVHGETKTESDSNSEKENDKGIELRKKLELNLGLTEPTKEVPAKDSSKKDGSDFADDDNRVTIPTQTQAVKTTPNINIMTPTQAIDFGVSDGDKDNESSESGPDDTDA